MLKGLLFKTEMRLEPTSFPRTQVIVTTTPGPVSKCGNGLRDEDEECDDTNRNNQDGI